MSRLVLLLLVASLFLMRAESKPQIHSYNVADVNAEVFDEQDDVEESRYGRKYVEIQDEVEDGASPTRAAGGIAFEVLDEVGDALGSKGDALRKMERLLKNSRGVYGR